MRKTKVMQILSLAASVATPTLAFAGAAQVYNGGYTAVGPAATAYQPTLAPSSEFALGVQLPQQQQATSSTWALLSGGSWNNANNWNGPIPNAADAAVNFLLLAQQSANHTIAVDGNFTVGSMTFNSPFAYQLIPLATPAPVPTLTVASGQINNVLGAKGNRNQIGATGALSGHTIRVNLGGTNGITLNGPGTMGLYANGTQALNSSFTGGMTLSGGGFVWVDGDTSLGDVNNTITMDNATLGAITNPLSAFRNFNIGAGGAKFTNLSIEIVGSVSGTGDIRRVGFNGSALVFSGDMTSWTGRLMPNDSGAIWLRDGARVGSSIIENGGVLALNQGGSSTNTNRIPDTATLNSYGGTFIQAERASAAGTSETTGPLNLKAGITTIIANDNPTVATNKATWKFGTLTRTNNSTLLVRGQNLGGGVANGNGNVSTISFSNGNALLLGGGGAPGSLNQSIIPFAIGSNVGASVAYNFVTHDANGARALLASEMDDLADGIANPTNNVTSIAPTATVNSAATMNALQITGAGTMVTGTGALTLTSGALLYSGTGTLAVVDNPITSPKEIIISGQTTGTAKNININGVISGTGGEGLTINGGNNFINNPSNTYTGPTTVSLGLLLTTGNVGNNVPSPLGNSSSPININAGGNSVVAAAGISGGQNAAYFPGNASPNVGAVIDRPINLYFDDNAFQRSRGTIDVGNNNNDGDAAVTFNGAITLNGTGNMRPNGSAPTPGPVPNDLTQAGLIYNGTISGNGGVEDPAVVITATQNQFVSRFNGNNTYSGGTYITTGALQLGSNTVGTPGALTSGPLGTGTIYFSGAGIVVAGVTTYNIQTGALQAFGADRTFGNYLQLTNNARFIGTQALNLTGTVDMNGNNPDGGTRGLTVDSTAPVTISGSIINGGFAKNGAGELIIPGAQAYTGRTIINNGTVTIGNNTSLGNSFSNAALSVTDLGGTIINGTGVLKMQGGISSADQVFMNGGTFVPTGSIRNAVGNNTLSNYIGLEAGTLGIGADAGTTLSHTGTFTTNISTANLTAGQRAVLRKVGAGNLNVRAMATNGTGTLGLGGVNVSAGNIKVLDNGTNTSLSRVGTLSISATSFVDMRDNDMILSSMSKSVVETYLTAGYNFGNYDGLNGMSTSKGAETGITTLGILDANEYANNNGDPNFDGVAVQPGDILVKYTYFGDVDFNGSVDVSDYNLIDFGFSNGFTGWANGDVDYSGQVDVSDYNLIDVAFANQTGTLRRAVQYLDGSDRSMSGMSDPALQKVAEHFEQFGETYASGFLAAVPEPTSLGIVGLAAGALMGRRRRRAAK